jgi:Ca2+-binding EF-hand superfamily protein
MVNHAGISLGKSEIKKLMSMISNNGLDTVSPAEFMRYFGEASDGGGETVSGRIQGRHTSVVAQTNVAMVDVAMHRWTNEMLVSHIEKLFDLEKSKHGGDATKVFQKHDNDRTGFITKMGLAEVIKEWEMDLSPQQFEWLCLRMTKGGKINYQDFSDRILDDGNTSNSEAVVTVEEAGVRLRQKVAQNYKSLQNAFRHYDSNKDAQISLDEVSIFFKGLGLQGPRSSYRIHSYLCLPTIMIYVYICIYHVYLLLSVQHEEVPLVRWFILQHAYMYVLVYM